MRLPNYQELSKEQLEIYGLPLDGSYLVTGPPGTGKTVMALYRAEMYREFDRNPKLIMYNKTLEDYTGNATSDLGVGRSVSTFFSWFWNAFPEWTNGLQVPQIKRYVYDWTEIVPKLVQAEIVDKPVLLIDEGQDLPPGFYTALTFLADHYTLFADENQRLTEERNSTLRDIRRGARISPENELSLTRNYRNTREIACLAREFFAGLETGMPNLPERKGEKPAVKKTASVGEAADFIARFERTNAHKKIGVFVPYSEQLDELHALLRERETRNRVRFYSSRRRRESNMNFSEPGIHVLCFASAKGLEFDAVFMPELQAYDPDLERAEAKMSLYVLLSRARDHLFLLYSGEDEPPLFSLFPNDLVRRS